MFERVKVIAAASDKAYGYRRMIAHMRNLASILPAAIRRERLLEE